MAYTTIKFEHPTTGKIKKAPVGFSWTTFFFGFFPALFRGDWKWGIIMLILLIITAGLAGFVFMFIYNKIYINGLIKAGYKASAVEESGIPLAGASDIDFAAQKMKIEIPRL